MQHLVNHNARGATAAAVPPSPHVSFSQTPGRSTRSSPHVALPKQLAELQLRSREVLRHHLVRHPAGGSLRRIGNLLLENMVQIQTLWRSVSDPEDMTPEAVERTTAVLQASHNLLDVVVSQLALCNATSRDALAIVECARRLIARESLKFHVLLPLVDRVFDEVRHADSLCDLTPICGLSLVSVVESQCGGAEPAVLVQGLTTARVLAWSLKDDRRLSDRLSRLVLAALFQDVGTLSLAATNPVAWQSAQQSDWLDRQHPVIGAGLFGTVRRAPPELPLMIAQHHEQLDGNGFPRSLPADEILPDAAILAAATRFARLCLEPINKKLTGDAIDDTKTSAAQTLIAEAEWGRWRLDYATLVAVRLAAERANVSPLPISADGQPSTASIARTSGSAPDVQWHAPKTELQGLHSEPTLVRRNSAPRRAIVIRQR